MPTTAALPATSKLTYEDFCTLPTDGKRHELVDGEHFMSPAPSLRHQGILGRLFVALQLFLREHPLGVAFIAPVDVVLSDFNVVEPDLVFVSAARAGTLTEANIQGAPDLVVEILSEPTRRHDLQTKRRLYERFGVREYWVVDPVLDTVMVFHLSGVRLERSAELTLEAGAVLASAVLPGFELPLAAIFEG
jgi:Uma2 family endonuclease